jgi:hypothetical protein
MRNRFPPNAVAKCGGGSRGEPFSCDDSVQQSPPHQLIAGKVCMAEPSEPMRPAGGGFAMPAVRPVEDGTAV